ncbi:MAG: glycosyltransferase [Cyclobacteriaceae bacterium]|nr:glycosyltransferase [Cyclobacteriaceae bacterium]
MRILIITPSYKPAFVYGGPTRSVSLLAESLVAAGNDVLVITTTANGPTELPVSTNSITVVDGVSVHYHRRWTGDHTHFSPALLWNVWRHARRFDIVHVQAWWNFVSVFAVAICLLRGVTPVLSPRGMMSAFSFTHQRAGLKGLLHRWFGARLIRRSWLHTTSALELTDCQRAVPGAAGFVLPNFVAARHRHDVRAVLPDNTRVGFLSRIDRKKGVDLLIRSLALSRQPWTLDIAGTGDASYLDELQKLSEQLHVAHRVRWHGWLDGDARFDFLQSVSLFALTSQNENFANVVIESLMEGTPVVVSNQVGLCDFVEQERLGWVTTLDPAHIAATLDEAIANNAERERIHNTAPQRARTVFTGAGLAARYQQEYQQLIAAHGH